MFIFKTVKWISASIFCLLVIILSLLFILVWKFFTTGRYLGLIKSYIYIQYLRDISHSLHDLEADSDKTTTEGSSQATSSRDLLCEPGWLNTGVINLGCLYFKSEKMNHAEARKYCQDNSSHLVEVQNQHQFDFIRIRAINENSGVPNRVFLLKVLAYLRIYIL